MLIQAIFEIPDGSAFGCAVMKYVTPEGREKDVWSDTKIAYADAHELKATITQSLYPGDRVEVVPVREIPIAELPISRWRTLARRGFKTVNELNGMSRRSLLRYKDIGKVLVNQIDEALKSYECGWELKP